MPTPLMPFHYKTLIGMNSKLEEDELSPNHGVLAQNCRFESSPGSATKRGQMKYYNATSLGEGGFNFIKRLYLSDGTATLVVAHGTSMYVGTDSGGTFAAIRTGLAAGKRFSSITYQDLTYFANGYDNIFIYDCSSDNVTWEMGSCKAVLKSTGAGNLDASADYYYAVSFYDGSTETGLTGAVSNTVATTASIQQIELSYIPFGPSGTTKRYIYRTEGNASTLYKIAELAGNSATTYTDNNADTTSTGYTVADDMPKGNLLNLHRERLFISGDPDEPNRIYYSNVYLMHCIRQTTDTTYLDIDKNDGDEIMGIPIQLGVMCCIKRNTLRKLHITSPVSTLQPSSWYADDPISFDGSPARWSIQQTPYGIVYLGWDHWYLFNGVTATPIIDEFNTASIAKVDYYDVVAHWSKGVLMAAYRDAEGSSVYRDKVMRYNLKRKSLGIDAINVSAFTSYRGDDETGDLYMGDSREGFVYMGDTTTLWIKHVKKTQLLLGKRNLLVNADLEEWTDGASSAPDEWTLAGASGTIARDGTNFVTGTYGAAITRAGTDVTLSQSIARPTEYQGNTVTIGAWIKASVANRARLQIDDGVGSNESDYHTGGGNFEWITVSYTMDSSASEFTARCQVLNGNTVCYFDSLVMVDYSSISGYYDNVLVDGDEDTPTVEVARDTMIDEYGSTVNAIVNTVNMRYTYGYIIFAPVQINAGIMGKLYWNQDLYSASDTIRAYTRTGATEAACKTADWSSAITNSNGGAIASTANKWFQLRIELVANSTAGSPLLYRTGGYVIKYSYFPGGVTNAETAVEFKFDTGYRTFELPGIDKIFKKIVCAHLGDTGLVKIYWYTENSEGIFEFDLATYPRRWESYFPDNAMGRKLSLMVYKNDLNDFRLDEIRGFFTPQPIIY